MTVHAFVDESERNGTYLLCAALIEPRHLGPVRKQMTSLLLPGQRELHFKDERPSRQRMLADRVARLPVSVSIYGTAYTPRTVERDRQRCVAQLLRDLREAPARRMVLDSRGPRDAHDRVTIMRLLGNNLRSDPLTYEHIASHADSLLWIPDAVGWCYGANGDWRRRIMPIIGKIIEV